MNRTRSRGFTLVELVIAIVVISTAGATLVGLLTYMSKRSAEEMTRSQSAALAQSYLSEIMGQPFYDLGGPAELGRSDYDDVSDYVMTNAVPADRFGNAIAALANYRVSVSVQPASLGTILAINCRRITVTVTDPFGNQVVLTAFKTAHA